VLVLGVAKSGFGGGIGILAVPLFLIALPAGPALGMLLPILIVADLFAVWQHVQHRDSRHLRPLLFGALFGILLGTLVLLSIRWLFQDPTAAEPIRTPELTRALNGVVGSACLLLVLLQVYRSTGHRDLEVPRGPAVARVFGCAAGVASTLAHSAGPVISIYLLEQRLPKRALVGTAAVFFLTVNLVKLPAYASLGLITGGTMQDALWTLPLIPVGAVLGLRLHHLVPEKPFTVLLYSGTAAAAVYLIWKASIGSG